MKRSALILSAVCALAITGVTLGQLGWFGSRATHTRGQDNADVAAAARWKQSQVTHWRSLLLQH